jgi:succinate dehydrogenase/fumarate reductase-like Fe-S protein
MNNFYEQYASVQPYLQRKEQPGDKENLQSPEGTFLTSLLF